MAVAMPVGVPVRVRVGCLLPFVLVLAGLGTAGF